MLIIDWRLGYANNPTIVLQEDLGLLPREQTEYQFQDGVFYNIQDNGLVTFFAHSGDDLNQGGYGGAAFDFIFEGKPKRVVGPWSSRASYLNTFLPEDKQIADIRLDSGKRYGNYCAILISELVKRWDQDAYLLRAKNKFKEEPGAVTASLAPDCIKKPDGYTHDDKYDYEIFAEPVRG